MNFRYIFLLLFFIFLIFYLLLLNLYFYIAEKNVFHFTYIFLMVSVRLKLLTSLFLIRNYHCLCLGGMQSHCQFIQVMQITVANLQITVANLFQIAYFQIAYKKLLIWKSVNLRQRKQIYKYVPGTLIIVGIYLTSAWSSFVL